MARIYVQLPSRITHVRVVRIVEVPYYWYLKGKWMPMMRHLPYWVEKAEIMREEGKRPYIQVSTKYLSGTFDIYVGRARIGTAYCPRGKGRAYNMLTY